MPRAAIVTGASSGIGAATARRLAADGLDLALAARSEDRLASFAEELRTEHGVDAVAVPTDVREEAAVEALVEATVERFGRLDALVNNAGLAAGTGDVAETSTEDYRTTTEVNQDGVFFATRAALPHVTEQSGHLVFVGSFAGKFPRPWAPVYAASKWWLRGFAHSLAAQVGDEDVAVTVVNPAEVRSEFQAGEKQPMADRYGPDEASEPEEVADAIGFAVAQDHSTVSELDLYRRDKFADELQ